MKLDKVLKDAEQRIENYWPNVICWNTRRVQLKVKVDGEERFWYISENLYKKLKELIESDTANS